jgi:hypothetical protein
MNSFTFLFEAMKETHDQDKTKIDIDELITGTTNITLSPCWDIFPTTHGISLGSREIS